MKKVIYLLLTISLISCGESSKSESKDKLTEKALTINGENMVKMRESIDAIKASFDSVQRDSFEDAWTKVTVEYGMLGAFLLPEKEKEIAFENFLKKVDGKTAEDIFKEGAKIEDIFK